jgi:hypothetical protein
MYTTCNYPLIALLLLSGAGTVLAGSLEPSAPPADPASALYTSTDLFNRLTTGAAGAKRTGPFVEPTAPPGPTGHTTDELMAAAPTADNANGATVAEVVAGKTFWGLRTDGTWGLTSGTMPTQVLNPASTAVPAGFYAATNLATVDPDLASFNIRAGISIFGVTGSPQVVDTTEAVDPATAANILSGKKAFVNGAVVTGSVPAGSNVSGGNGLKTFVIPDGLYSGSRTATANDANLVSGNIKGGVTIFGVAGDPNVVTTGDPNVVNTSSGTAVAGDILVGKKAWVTGVEVTGTRYPLPVSKTGQTLCYDSTGATIDCVGTGQDGSLQKGIAPPTPRFTDNLNGTVTDNATGLIWLKNANCSVSPKVWADALTFANNLSTGICALTDGSSAGQWRLPNRRELQSLADLGSIDSPGLPAGHPFQNLSCSTQSCWYWSSSNYAEDTTRAWIVDMVDGTLPRANDNKYFSWYAWPVRGGQ